MKLQERFSTLSPVYMGELTNHLPMVITALRLLDIDEKTIEMIAEDYLSKRHIVDLSDSGIENDFFSDEYIRLTNFFLAEFKEKSIDMVLSQQLNELQFGLHSGLFHGLIRVAYAYLSDDELLTAQGLAYFSLISKDLHLKGDVSEDLNKSFVKLINSRKTMNFEKKRTMEMIDELLENEEIVNNLFIPADMVRRKEEALQFFLDYFNKTKDFYILHVITGYHALHVLSHFFNNIEDVYHNFFRQAQLFMLINDHSVYFEKMTEVVGFPVLAKLVPNMRDAHDIKFFYSLAYFHYRYELVDLVVAANLIFTNE